MPLEFIPETIVGKLSQDETAELLTTCLNNMTLERVILCLTENYGVVDLDEISSSCDLAARDKEEEEDDEDDL